jgi:hypothetical protein
MKHSDTRRFWGRLNWNWQDCQIADVLNRDKTLVRYWRKKLGKGPARTHYKHTCALKSDGYVFWNWSHSNAELAREHGFSREYVRALRSRLGAPLPDLEPWRGRFMKEAAA